MFFLCCACCFSATSYYFPSSACERLSWKERRIWKRITKHNKEIKRGELGIRYTMIKFEQYKLNQKRHVKKDLLGVQHSKFDNKNRSRKIKEKGLIGKTNIFLRYDVIKVCRITNNICKNTRTSSSWKWSVFTPIVSPTYISSQLISVLWPK